MRAHFVIASFVGRWTRGEARVSKEIDAVASIEPDACEQLLTTPELADILACARRIEERNAVRRRGRPANSLLPLRDSPLPLRERTGRERPGEGSPRRPVGSIGGGLPVDYDADPTSGIASLGPSPRRAPTVSPVAAIRGAAP